MFEARIECLQLNLRKGLLDKFASLSNLILFYKIKLCFFSEVSCPLSSLPFLKNYRWFLSSSEQVAILAHCDLPISFVKPSFFGCSCTMHDANQSSVWCKIAPRGKAPVFVCSFYRNPGPRTRNCSRFVHEVENANRIVPHCKLLVCGDFNAHHSDWGSSRNCKHGLEIVDCLAANEKFYGNLRLFALVTSRLLPTALVDAMVSDGC